MARTLVHPGEVYMLAQPPIHMYKKIDRDSQDLEYKEGRELASRKTSCSLKSKNSEEHSWNFSIQHIQLSFTMCENKKYNKLNEMDRCTDSNDAQIPFRTPCSSHPSNSSVRTKFISNYLQISYIGFRPRKLMLLSFHYGPVSFDNILVDWVSRCIDRPSTTLFLFRTHPTSPSSTTQPL